MRYFISDTHWGHANIIKYTNRPFRDKYEMDRVLIENWNSVVKPEDTIYHLGDVAFYGKDRTSEIFASLAGYKILIRGNHDKGLSRMRRYGFNEAYNNLRLILMDGREVFLSHYPYRYVYENDPYVKSKLLDRCLRDEEGKWLLCGHVHDKWKNIDKIINVGVDVWNFFPVSEEQICAYINELEK